RVGRLIDQALELVQQVADFVQTAFRGANDVGGAVGVVDGGGDAGLLGLERLAGDQACRVIGAGVDFQAGAQPLQAGVQILVVHRQRTLCDQRADVCIDNTHDNCLS